MVGFRTTREEIQRIYNEVYQQNMLPGPHHVGQSGWRPLIRKSAFPCKSRHGRGRVPPGQKRIWRGATAGILWPSCLTESCCRTQVSNKDQHDQALTEAREAHWRALEATHFLEQNIERLSWERSRAKSAECQHPYSHGCLRGSPQGRHPWSPSPPRPKKHVTFLDQEEEMSSPSETTGDVWSLTEPEYLKWVKVHPSCAVASVGSIPSNPGDLRWHCHNHNSSWQKRAQHCLEEDKQALRGTSSSALPGSSPELAPWEEVDLGAKPKVLPLGFQETAKSLMAGKSPEMEVDCPLPGASLGLSAGSTVATVTSTTMCQDQTMGTIYLSMMTTSMGLMKPPQQQLAPSSQPQKN